MESFRLLIALAAKLKLNVNFFDVKTAYLYGDLKETVYVLPPPGYEKLIGDDKVCKLKKSIYGFRHSLVETANRTRPDISFVTSYLPQFNHNPEKRHYNLAKRVLKYLMGSKDKKLFYEKKIGILNASPDASWGNAENGKSFSGGVVLLDLLWALGQTCCGLLVRLAVGSWSDLLWALGQTCCGLLVRLAVCSWSDLLWALGQTCCGLLADLLCAVLVIVLRFYVSINVLSQDT
ncbi:retrovirus-related Pol polyprotein from transposon TNT 1-94 [Trichonephila clavipes]|nr:retrovirus-related Pol polyprotein from transposon TNT 1-94 [Trichonephila clavipes]